MSKTGSAEKLIPRTPVLAGETHFVVNTDLTPGDIIQFTLQQLPLQRLQVIDEQLALNMIILMQDDAGRDAIISLRTRFEGLIQEIQRHFFAAEYIFSDLRNAQTALIVRPLFPIDRNDMRIDKDLLDTRPVRILVLFIFFQVLKDLTGVDDKKPDIPVHLWRSQPHAVAGVHCLPHILYQLRQIRKIRRDFFADLTKDRSSISNDG